MARRLLFYVLSAALCAGPLYADGERLFTLHCAACHGRDATGSGPMTEALTLVPPDLTRLAAQNGGDFPAARMAAQIDGRDPLIPHGGSMPVYGWFFEGPPVTLTLPDGTALTTTKDIAAILAWLERRQKP